MRFWLLAPLLLTLCMTAQAADPVDPALAMEYLTATKMEEVLNASIDEYYDQLSKGAPPEQREMLRRLLLDSVGWGATRDQLVELVTDLYSKDELEASIAFMKSPSGAAFTAKNAEFSKRYTSFIVLNLQKVLSKCCDQAK